MSLHSSTPDPRYADLTDDQLIAAHVAGDPDAFGELARRHVRYLHAVARRVAAGVDDADDIVQTALIAALRATATYEGRASVRSWLARITINTAVDLRRRWRHQPHAQRQPVEESLILADRADPGALVGGRLTVERLLDSLPPRERRMVLMVDLLGFTVRETAERLGVAEGTVKSARSRAFAALARRIR